ncbi:MAG TPA: hypothetical protein VG960_10530 [Caulobacteraceae bacterium]|nr:hypothetical protein [Caulobacteraceae bacterium]
MALVHAPRNGRHAPVLRATQARAGLRGRHVLWVLIISTALAALALFALLAIQAPGLSGPGGQVTSQQPTINAPQSPARQNLTR